MKYFVFFILLADFIVGCQEDNPVEQHVKVQESEYLCELLKTVDSSKILNNKFLNSHIEALSADKFIPVRQTDSLPQCIKEQLNFITTDNFRALKIEESLDLYRYCPDNPLNLPCRKIEYIGRSNQYVIISYLQICKSCNDYANNILIFYYDENQIKDMWIGAVHPFDYIKITEKQYDIIERSFNNYDSIVNYLDNKLKNSPNDLQELGEIVI